MDDKRRRGEIARDTRARIVPSYVRQSVEEGLGERRLEDAQALPKIPRANVNPAQMMCKRLRM